MKLSITFEQLAAFARHNNIWQYTRPYGVEITPEWPYILHRADRFGGIIATYYLAFKDGTVSLFPEKHPEFAKTIDSLPALVERIQQDCHIETILPNFEVEALE
jgi:hypothetical protein